jgi:dTDP-4-amino-4,6-dideoxygalactose transaminase
MSEWPVLNEKMINSVTEILKSGKLNQWNNNAVRDFENKFAKHIGCDYAVAVSNGTLALELCIKTLNIKEDDEVIVTPRTYIASALCCTWYGITPIFVDVDIESQNITLESIKKYITTKTRAVILVHLAGWPCDMQEICDYCREKNIYIIEDCAQAHGSKYNNKSVGTWGDINAWSFCQDKIITTGGEGGMVTTNSKDLFELAWSIKDHGKGFDSVFNKKHEKGFRWLHENNGTNWRMLPIQASIGICALDELDNWVKHRQSIANIYNNELKNVKGIRLTIPPSNIIHSYYKYYFFITPEKFQKTRDDIIDLINKENIFCQIGSCGEIYKEKSLCKYQPNYVIKNAQILFETALILKCDPCVTETKAFEDINKIKNILQNNLKAFVD